MRKYIPHIIIAVLMIAVALQAVTNTRLIGKVATEKQKVIDLRKQAAQYDIQIKDFESGKLKLEDSIKGLNLQIADGKSLIKTIQNELHENIKIIERFTVSDMQQFFDDRYGSAKKP